MSSQILYICLQEELEFEDELKKKQDEFLDLYSLYQATGLSWIKEELLDKAYQLHVLKPDFKFYL
jgi:hypothetical protein